MPLPDQQPPALVVVQIKLLDSYSLGSLAIGCFNRAEMSCITIKRIASMFIVYPIPCFSQCFGRCLRTQSSTR